jgi:transposase
VSRKVIEALIAGKGINDIARTLKMGKERIRKIRGLGDAAGYLDGTVPLPLFPETLFRDEVDKRWLKTSAVDDRLQAHLPWINDRIAAGWHAITIFEELPVKTTRSSFYRFLKRHGLYHRGRRPQRVVPEIVHAPGEALLVDWGKVASVIDPKSGKRRTVWAFVGVLGYSRYRMVRLVMTQDTATTLAQLESMFQELGGVARKLTSDNPKCFALTACRYEPLLNPIYERFAAYYDTAIECLPPADPEKKGKVERPMPFIRRLLESFDGDWHDLAYAQAFIDRKLAVANDCRHGTTGEKPLERLAATERAALKPLPKLTWQREEYHEGLVRRDGHVRFRGKYYSLDETLIGEDVQIIGNQTTVWLYHRGRLTETHARVTDPTKSKSTKPHHLKPWERALTDTSVYRDRARTLGPHVDELVVRIIGNGLGVIDFRKVWGLLNLDKSYTASAIDDACKRALAMGSTRLRTVKSLLALVPKAGSLAPADNELAVTHDGDGAKDRVNRFTRSIKEYGAVVASLTAQ